MARYKFIAQCNAREGHEAEFDAWYSGQHVPDVLRVPGFISAERYQLIGEGPQLYMAIYEIETEDLSGTLQAMGERAGSDLMPISDAMDLASVQTTAWAPIEGGDFPKVKERLQNG